MVWPGERSETRQMVAWEARGWGVQTALTNAFAGPLLVARGADVLALGLYNAGITLCGLGAGLLGPMLARQIGGVSHAVLGALAIGRIALLLAALSIVAWGDGLVIPLIVALVVWSAGEGIALPLWKTFVANLERPSERRTWISWRASVAATTVAAILPPLVALSLIVPGRAWQIAFLAAAVAGLISFWQLARLFRDAPPPALPAPLARLRQDAPTLTRFLVANFLFWFGAALNRPVMPVYLVRDLGATAAYFAVAAAAGAIAGAAAQKGWGFLAGRRPTRTLLAWSGLGASIAPLLWIVTPVSWVGVPVEMLAASCWLGHLLGVAIRSAELAHDDAERPGLLARVYLMQGAAATIAALAGAAAMSMLGARPVLAASGVLCLTATWLLAELRAPASWERLLTPRPGWASRRWA